MGKPGETQRQRETDGDRQTMTETENKETNRDQNRERPTDKGSETDRYRDYRQKDTKRDKRGRNRRGKPCSLRSEDQGLPKDFPGLEPFSSHLCYPVFPLGINSRKGAGLQHDIFKLDCRRTSYQGMKSYHCGRLQNLF